MSSQRELRVKVCSLFGMTWISWEAQWAATWAQTVATGQVVGTWEAELTAAGTAAVAARASTWAAVGEVTGENTRVFTGEVAREATRAAAWDATMEVAHEAARTNAELKRSPQQVGQVVAQAVWVHLITHQNQIAQAISKRFESIELPEKPISLVEVVERLLGLDVNNFGKMNGVARLWYLWQVWELIKSEKESVKYVGRLKHLCKCDGEREILEWVIGAMNDYNGLQSTTGMMEDLERVVYQYATSPTNDQILAKLTAYLFT